MLTRTAKEYRMLNLEQISEAEYYGLKREGMLYEYFPEATGNRDNDLKRIDIISQNGNDGSHYKNDIDYRVSGSDSPEVVDYYDTNTWPHKDDDDYATKIEKLYNPPKDNMFVDDYCPSDCLMGSEDTSDQSGAVCRGHDMISNPKHYQIGNTGLQAIDIIEAVLDNNDLLTQGEAYYYGNVLKYLIRAPEKNGVEDIKKAKVYLDWLLTSLGEEV